MKSNLLDDSSFEDRFYKKALSDIKEIQISTSDYISKVMNLEKIFLKQRDVVKKIILMENFENIFLKDSEIKVGNIYFTLDA